MYVIHGFMGTPCFFSHPKGQDSNTLLRENQIDHEATKIKNVSLEIRSDHNLYSIPRLK